MKLTPTKRYNRIYDIPVSFLMQTGIKLIFADMDNTLAPWHSDAVSPETCEWVKTVSANGIEVALLTNSKGNNADSIGAKLGINVYKGANKPFAHVTRELIASKKLSPEAVMLVGDQLFTDIQLANALGAKSVLTKPLEKREWWCTKVFNRTRERIVWRLLFGEKYTR